MSVDSIPQVAKADPIGSSTVSDATRRSVSKSDVESFTLALNSTSNTTQASSLGLLSDSLKPLLNSASNAIAAGIQVLDLPNQTKQGFEIIKTSILNGISDTLNTIKELQSAMKQSGSSINSLSQINNAKTALENAQNVLTTQIDPNLPDADFNKYIEKPINDAKSYLQDAELSIDKTNNSITLDDVSIQIDKSLVNNMIQQMQEDRQKLKEAIEGEG